MHGHETSGPVVVAMKPANKSLPLRRRGLAPSDGRSACAATLGPVGLRQSKQESQRSQSFTKCTQSFTKKKIFALRAVN